MAQNKKSRSDRYKDSPTMKRDEESGKMKATKKPTADAVEPEAVSDGIPPVAKHGMERMALHGKHEQEHFAHDHAKAGGKEELHKRHAQEFKDMAKRHDAELGKGK